MTSSRKLSGPVRLVAILALAFITANSSVLADAPTVAYIFPAGGQRGQTVEFRVGGHYLHGDCPFEMLGGGIEAPSMLRRSSQMTWFDGPLIPLPDSQRKEDYPWEHTADLKIASDASLGFRRWRVWTSQGVTPTMKFVVGDLPEVVEREVAGEPIPTHVALPVTINGRIFPREARSLICSYEQPGRCARSGSRSCQGPIAFWVAWRESGSNTPRQASQRRGSLLMWPQ